MSSGRTGSWRFLEARRASGYTSRVSQRGLRPLLGYLRGLGVVPSTVGAGGLHAGRAAGGGLPRLSGMRAGTGRRHRVSLPGCRADFPIGDRAAGWTRPAESDRRRRDVLCRPRVPRALASVGDGAGDRAAVAAAVLAAWRATRIASWRRRCRRRRSGPRDRCPEPLSTDVVAAMRASCDEHTVVGARDFAILTVLHRLGLRAGEVAGLELADLDWRHGEFVVRGKANRQERLPLPADVGEAVVAYLRRPPRVACRALFLTVRAPIVGTDPRGGRPTRARRLPARRACRRLAPIGCVTAQPRPRWPAALRWPKSASCCGSAPRPRRPSTPRSTGPRCGLSPCRGREVRHERSASGGRGLHRGPPGTGRQARAAPPAAG